MSMTGIGIVLLSLTMGSFALAGLLTAAATLAAAVVAPLWGRATDRVGQARVLILTVLINVLSVALLVTAIELAWPLAVGLVAAIGVGIGFSLAGSAVRARWTLRLNGSPLLHTAFALEAMLDEVVFIIGPVLVTFLATALHPALGVSVSAVIGLIGAVALAAQRGGQPPIRLMPHGHRESSRLPWRVLVPVAIASGALGMVFGGMELNVESGRAAVRRPDLGRVVVRISGSRRRDRGDHLAGVSGSALPSWGDPAHAGPATAPVRQPSGGRCPAADPQWHGYCANPDRIGWGDPVGGRSEPTDRGLAWNSTGMVTGVAAGAAAVGYVIDSSGPQAGFVAVAVAGLLLTLSALFVRGPAPVSSRMSIRCVRQRLIKLARYECS